jgi:hypothetical protein
VTRRSKRLLLEFAIALGVCGAIAIFDRVLIGLAGAVLCAVVFAVRALLSTPQKEAPNAEAGDEMADAVSKSGHTITGLVPYRYDFGNPIYHPQDEPPDARGR